MNQEKAKFPEFSQLAVCDKEYLIWFVNFSEPTHPKLVVNTQQLNRHRCRIWASDSANNMILRASVKMRYRRLSKALSKLKAIQTRQLTVCWACTCLPLKCFQNACKFIKKWLHCNWLSAISSLRPGLASQSITGSSLSPLHCVSLFLPRLFPCMLTKQN